ncbi:MAG TPA: lysophospholipid acyltransferase family protein [Candidatus Limnocylindria bacterium]|nr:lysophospholipid acyltransferase family protein [Candidatus Limnocylindria bacterium]
MQISAFIRTIVSRFLLLLIMLVCAIPALLILPLPARWRYHSKLYTLFADFFYRAVVWASLLPVKFVGAENIPHTPAIIVANHQSSLDIPLVGAVLRRYPHIWLATHELLRSPILRFIVPRVAVLVDMSSPIKGMKTLIEAIKILNGYQMHAIIFPEGGRFTDGEIHHFYAGFVMLAKKTGRPVVPIRIFGVDKVYPPKSFLVNYYPITVVVGQPMAMQENETDEQFKDRVYQWFVEQKEV